MEEKITRYKMYKSRDKWVVAGISMCGGILAMISGNGGIASANSISQINYAPNNPANQNSKVISNNSITSQSLKQQSNVINNSQNTTNNTIKDNQVNANNTNITSAQLNNSQSISKVQNNQSLSTTKNNNSTNIQPDLLDNQNINKSQAQNNINTQTKVNNNQALNNQSIQNQKMQVNNNKSNFTVTAPNAPITDKLPAAVDNNHTPDYHIHDAQGWSNDVQTITQDSNGTYNIYFLHSVDGATNPFGPNGQDWEHVTTKDWKTFQDQGVAINSHGTSNPNSWKSAWTGSIITNNGDITGVPKGAEVAYFSGLSKADGSQNIWAAWSDDNGKTFTHALNDGVPVLAWNQAGASGKKDQERDADVIYFNNELLMYTAEGNQLGVYKSTDGIHWSKADPNGASKVQSSTFFHGLNWKDSNNIPVECPQIRLMKANDGTTKAVLFFGAKDPNGNPPQTTGTYYIIGHLDKNGMFAYENGNNATRLDLGSDYYGANISGNDSLSDAHDSLIGLGWIGNWNYTSQGVYNNQNVHKYPQDKLQLENHLGSYSLPRKIQLISDGNGKYHLLLTSENSLSPISKGVTSTINNPSNGNNKLEDMGKDANYGDVYDLIDHANQPADSIQQLTFNTTDGSQYNGRIYIDINQGKDKLVFNYDPDNGMMMVNGYAEELDNDMSGESASSAYYDGALGKGKGYLVNTGFVPQKGKSFTINVFCDKTSVELEFPNGVWYTVARYASQDTQDFKVYTQDPRKVNEVTNTRMQINSIEAQNNQSPNNKPSSSNTNSSQNKPSNSTNTSNTNNQKPNASNTNKNEPSTNANNKPSSSTPNNPSQNGNSSNTNNQKPSNNTPSTNNQKPNNKPSNNQKPGSSDNNSNQNKPNISNTNSSNSQSSNNTQSSNKPNSNINNSNQSGSAGDKGTGTNGVDKNNQNNGGNKQSGNNTNNSGQSKNDDSQPNNGNINSNNTTHNNQPSNSDNSNTHSSSVNSTQQTKPNNSSSQSNNQNKSNQSGNSSNVNNNQRPSTDNTSNNNKPSSSTINQNKPNSSQQSNNSNTQTSDINNNSNSQSNKNNQNKNNSNNINSSDNGNSNVAKNNTQVNNTNIQSSNNSLNNSAQEITKSNSLIDDNNKGNNIVNANNELNEEKIISNNNRVNNNATSILPQQNQNISSINYQTNITKLNNYSLNSQVGSISNNKITNNSNELPQTGDNNSELLLAMTGLIGLLGISELKKKY